MLEKRFKHFKIMFNVAFYVLPVNMRPELYKSCCVTVTATSDSYFNMFIQRITQCTSVEDVRMHTHCNLLLNTSGLVPNGTISK